MKKNIFRALSIIAVASLMASCNKQASKMDEAVEAEGGSVGMRLAYVEIDSLTTQYEFAKEKTAELEKKSANARNTIAQKTQQLESNVNNFQRKLQNNGFTSREQAENAQAALQREQNNLVALQQRLENELAQEQSKFLQALQDSLDSFLTIYNQDKKYDMIVNKAAVLFADPKYDITQDVINGMNKRYKKESAKKEDKLEAKEDSVKK